MVWSGPNWNRLVWGGFIMTRYGKLRAYFAGSVATALLGAASFVSSSPATAAPCTGPGAPATTQTKCLTAVAIPGNPLRSFDISWVNPFLNQYYFADRSNAGIEVINTVSNMFTVRLGGFVGIKLNPNGTVNNNISGPD